MRITQRKRRQLLKRRHKRMIHLGLVAMMALGAWTEHHYAVEWMSVMLAIVVEVV